MISASLPALSCNRASRGRRCSVHSGMVDSGNETHSVDEGLPSIAVARQHPAAFSRQTVEAATTLPGPLDPPALQPAAFFQPIEERVQRCDVELQLPCRARLDEL